MSHKAKDIVDKLLESETRAVGILTAIRVAIGEDGAYEGQAEIYSVPAELVEGTDGTTSEENPDIVDAIRSQGTLLGKAQAYADSEGENEAVYEGEVVPVFVAKFPEPEFQTDDDYEGGLVDELGEWIKKPKGGAKRQAKRHPAAYGYWVGATGKVLPVIDNHRSTAVTYLGLDFEDVGNAASNAMKDRGFAKVTHKKKPSALWVDSHGSWESMARKQREAIQGLSDQLDAEIYLNGRRLRTKNSQTFLFTKPS